MTDIAIVGFAHAPHVTEADATTNGIEMLAPCLRELYAELGITKSDIGFWCSGSSDYLAGRAFSFISAIDAIGAVPPVNESHVEMDAAWALYEAWIKLLTGEVDTALVYGFGKSSAGDLRKVLALQLDPYTVAPLWPDAYAIAGLQARAGIDAGNWTEADMAAVAGGSLDAPYVANPLRAHDIAPYTDGAAAVVLAVGDRARELCARPAWIAGIEHRIESPHFGLRDLTRSESTAAAARAVGVHDIDHAEFHAPFTHQHLMVAAATGTTAPFRPNPMFAAGLERIGFAARQIFTGSAGRVLAHATSGPALQQNLVMTMEAR